METNDSGPNLAAASAVAELGIVRRRYAHPVSRCPKCTRQVADGTWLCDCGHEFSGAETLPGAGQAGADKFLVFLASLVPITVLLFGPLSSEWFFNRYGFFGAWVLLPVALIISALVQAVTYYRYIFVSRGVLFRLGASLALSILGVLLPFGLCVLLHSVAQ